MQAIRAMTRDDLNEVKRLEEATAEAPHWSPVVYEGFLSEDDHGGQIFVVEEGRRLAGFIAARIVLDTCELESIVVDRAVRRSGVGKALFTALMQWARQRDAVRMELEVRERNNSAIYFYERLGFVRNGVRPRYYQVPEEDAVLLSLALDS